MTHSPRRETARRSDFILKIFPIRPWSLAMLQAHVQFPSTIFYLTLNDLHYSRWTKSRTVVLVDSQQLIYWD